MRRLFPNFLGAKFEFIADDEQAGEQVDGMPVGAPIIITEIESKLPDMIGSISIEEIDGYANAYVLGKVTEVGGTNHCAIQYYIIGEEEGE